MNSRILSKTYTFAPELRNTRFGDISLWPHIRNLLIHSNMENIIVLSGEQLEDVIYKTVSRCLEEKHIGNYVEKPEEDGFYSRDEICSLLHIAYPTLWRIEKSGLLKSQKVGRKNLYSKAEVNQLMKSGKLAKYSHRK